MTWDVAKSLDQLLAQINALAPNRSKKSDGSIGDTAHQGTVSDHNPEDKPGDEPDEVDARDFTHDPANGADMHRIAEALRLSRDRRIRYVIFNRRYFSPKTGWKWVEYHGDNPHDKHMHVSVNDVDDDNTAPWDIGEGDQLSGEASEIIKWEIRPWLADTNHTVGRIEQAVAGLLVQPPITEEMLTRAIVAALKQMAAEGESSG